MPSAFLVLTVALMLLNHTAAVPAAQERPGNGVVMPQVVRDVKPQYTEAARKERIQGVVTLEAVVKEDGSVGDVTVVKSLEQGLDAEAVKAMRQWEFKPGTKNGKPVAVAVQVEMTFTLK
jgi:periplasmic protein TonB